MLRFVLTFGVLLVLAEGILRGIGFIQNELGWQLVDMGASFEEAGFAAAITNGLFALIGMIALFGFLEWRQFGFTNFMARYAQGLAYGATALVITIVLQSLAFAWLANLEFEPLFRADQIGGPLIFFTVIYMVVIGFFEYWLHRALHQVPILWRFHAIHHQIEGLNAARSYSHWGQDLLYLAVITIPLVFLIENPHEHIALLTTFYLVSNYYMHTDNPALSFPPALRHVLADNVYHHYHHSRQVEHWGRNYCSFFSFFDRIFGTQHMPKDETFHPTGIAGYRPLSGWLDYLVRPFARKE